MKLGIIGYGNMSSAIINGAIDKGVIDPGDVSIYDPNPDKVSAGMKLGLKSAKNSEELAKVSDIVLLAVKPQQIEKAAHETKGGLEGKALISIAAGAGTARLRAAFEVKNMRLLRLLPNTPALVSEGATALCLENDLTDSEREFAENLFKAIGLVIWVNEYDLDAVCGLSGAGPAYAAMFIEALADGGVEQGLKRDISYKLAAQTVLGTAKMILDKGLHPGELKDIVTSPAGTTIEGVKILEKSRFRYAAMQAVIDSAKRSREL